MASSDFRPEVRSQFRTFASVAIALIIPIFALRTSSGCSEEDPCDDCSASQEYCDCPWSAYYCDSQIPPNCYFITGAVTGCFASQGDCDASCDDACNDAAGVLGYCDYSDATTIPCTPGGDTGSHGSSCSTWSPSSNIYLSSGVYHVDQTWAEGVLDFTWPLVDCDSGRLNYNGSTGFAWQTLDSNDAGYLLGFRNGDVITKVNNMQVDTLPEALDAFEALRYQTSFSVEFKRRTSTLTYYYVLD